MSDEFAGTLAVLAFVGLIVVIALVWHQSAKAAPVQQPQCEREARRPGCRVLMVAEGGRAAA